jgi:hypothetical protein
MLKRTISIILEQYDTITYSNEKKIKLDKQEVLPKTVLPELIKKEVSIKVLPKHFIFSDYDILLSEKGINPNHLKN